MVRAQCSESPLIILQGLRAGRGTVGRVTVSALYVLGYFGMGLLWAGAIEKVLAPSRGGLWYTPGDFGPPRWSSGARHQRTPMNCLAGGSSQSPCSRVGA